ncbi:MAG: methylornithine synthase PylB [Synergistaceae bacterium]|jgi:methylornithine synthase|nr:methylornithine synthase PylB [Synergistaceae bacterium]
MIKKNANDFDETLQMALDEFPLEESHLEILLDAHGSQCDALYAAARTCRQRHFANRLFGYGFIYFSTYCRNNCTFCFYRKSNSAALRYRKTKEEVIQTAKALAESGVHLLDLTLGEDPHYVLDDPGYDMLLDIADEMRMATGLPVMISPGVMGEKRGREAARRGISFYACYQETHNRRLFSALRQGQDYQTRLDAKLSAHEAGMLIEEGILVGVGEALSDIAHSICTMKEIGAEQVRVMSFVPQDGAPLRRSMDEGLYLRELNTIAVMRILMPNRFIPASLDVAGKGGLKDRLDAGANIVTSLIMPESGFAGVSNATLDVDSGLRSLPGILDTIDECGLQMGSQVEFERVLHQLREECERRCA